MKLRHLLISLLALLLVTHVQRAVADDRQPRFVVPTAALTCGDGSTGYSAITEGNPYFTIYLWIRNTDHVHTYWSGAPTLKVDGNPVTLTGLNNGDGTETCTEWTCKKDGKTVYYVKAHGTTFKAGDNELFQDMFSGVADKDKGNRDDDRYIGLDIYMYENRHEDNHTVSVIGTFCSDDGVGHHDVSNTSALTLDGESEATTGRTIFNFKDTGWSLLWTSPCELTYSSPDFEAKSGWGKYSVKFNGKESEQKSNGSVTVKSTVNNPTYKGSVNYNTSFYYKGKYADKYEIVFIQDSTYTPTSLTYPSNLNATYDAWDKKITLQWKTGNSGNYSGSYDLYRDGTYLTTVSSGNTHTDKVDSYGTYNYKVYFVPDLWPDGTMESQICEGINATLNRSFELGDLNVGVNNAKDGYLLTWTASSYTPSATTYYNIYRKVVSSPDESVTFNEGDKLASVKASTATTYSYEDKDVNSTSTYCYMVSIEVQDYNYQSKPTQSSEHISGSSLTSFTATRGTYTDCVKLNWTVNLKAQDKMTYIIKRHTIDDSGLEQYLAPNAFAAIDTIYDGRTTYTDTRLNCGYYYMYRIDAVLNDNQSQFISSYCDGFARNTATVTGNVTFENSGKTVGVEGVRIGGAPPC